MFEEVGLNSVGNAAAVLEAVEALAEAAEYCAYLVSVEERPGKLELIYFPDRGAAALASEYKVAWVEASTPHEAVDAFLMTEFN